MSPERIILDAAVNNNEAILRKLRKLSSFVRNLSGNLIPTQKSWLIEKVSICYHLSLPWEGCTRDEIIKTVSFGAFQEKIKLSYFQK